jgi:hypothetical protein
MTQPAFADVDRCRVASEVLELGEALFDTVLDAASIRCGAEPSEPLPEAELRTAAEEFFRTVRVLLGLGDTPDREPVTGRGQEGG